MRVGVEHEGRSLLSTLGAKLVAVRPQGLGPGDRLDLLGSEADASGIDADVGVSDAGELHVRRAPQRLSLQRARRRGRVRRPRRD